MADATATAAAANIYVVPNHQMNEHERRDLRLYLIQRPPPYINLPQQDDQQLLNIMLAVGNDDEHWSAPVNAEIARRTNERQALEAMTSNK